MHNSLEENEFHEAGAEAAREAEFLRQLELSYHDLYAAGLIIVGNRDDADDVIQEVCVVLWQKFDEFEEIVHFKKWASTITFNVAKAFARKQRRRRGFGLSDHALARVAQMNSHGSELFELRCEVLQECLTRMNGRDRDFLCSCYRNSTTLTSYAREAGLSVETIYTRLKRLRKRLSECMNRRMEGAE